MTILILLCAIVAQPVPHGIKDPEKWLAAMAKREEIIEQRTAIAYQMRRAKHLQQYYDRQERLRNYPWESHPIVLAQNRGLVVQAVMFDYFLYSMWYRIRRAYWGY